MSDGFAAVPDELKERDQWLFWNASADKPKKPLATPAADHGAAWTDPDEWVSFDEAVEKAERVPEAGIGFVFANDVDSYPRGVYGALDLDGCVVDGSPAEWLPSLSPFFDAGAYVERSPSGEGIHIPLAGFEPPEWWSDVARDDHEGVEAYGKKFFTFTGDKLRRSGDGVADTGEYVEEWLKEAHENITGDRPWEDAEEQASAHSPGRPADARGEAFGEAGGQSDVMDALNRIDARDVADRLPGWVRNEGAASGGNVAYFPPWGGPDCNGTANVVDAEGWSDTGTDSGFGRVTEMAAIDLGELHHSGCEWGDADGETFWNAVDRLRELGFDIPEADTSSPPSTPPSERGGEADADDTADATGTGREASAADWEWVKDRFADSDTPPKTARRCAANVVQRGREFVYLDEEDALLEYQPDSGMFDRGAARDVKRTLVGELGEEFSRHDRNEVLAMVQDGNAVDPDTLNAGDVDEPLLCAANGVLNVETREVYDHSPEYRFTRSIPPAVDPDADAPNAEAFLSTVTDSEGEKKTLEEMMGAALHPDKYVKAKFLFLFGDGQNGKGVYFDLLEALLGTGNTTGRGLHEFGDNRFAKSDLRGKLANIGGDIDDRKLDNVGELKELTGGDLITAEEKNQPGEEFTNTATMFFAANSPPVISDKKRSMARRIVPIHMKHEFVPDPDPSDPYEHPERDKSELLAEMTTDDELSGLLNLALDGLGRLMEQGDVSLPRGPMERLDHYQRFSDPIYRFADECLKETRGERVKKSDVYELYRQFSDEEGHAVRHNSVFWRELRRVFNVEETRVDPPDGGREWLLERAEFDSEAIAKYGGDVLAEKYGGAKEPTDAPGAGATADTAALEELSKGTGVELGGVTVAEKYSDPPAWLQGKGTLTDARGNPAAYVCENANPLATVAEGDTVNIRRATVEDRKAGMTVVLSGIATVEKANRPSGQAPIDTATDGGESPETRSSGDTTDDTPDTKETADDDESGVSADADGETVRELSPGEKSIQKAVMDYLADHTEPGDEVTVAEVAASVDRDPETVRDRLDKFAAMGTKVMESEGGEYERF